MNKKAFQSNRAGEGPCMVRVVGRQESQASGLPHVWSATDHWHHGQWYGPMGIPL